MRIEPFLSMLHENALFRGLSHNELKDMLSCFGAYLSFHQKNETVAIENEKLEGIGIILEGSVSIGKDSASGDRMMIARLGTGEMFGEVAAFSGTVWTATVVAEKDTRILFIPPRAFLETENTDCAGKQKVSLNLLQIVSMKAKHLNEKIELLSLKGIRKKICGYLLMQHGKTMENEFTVPLKRGEMAEFLQVSRPSLSRELTLLKEEGIIDFEGSHFQLKDMDALADQLKF
ncbi:Crp/Fnr family transcriptional regulator [Proteiniclasticum sp.]|uniref:Crp/Fnr family transcriptional regulator n=1 Tax=Proteiniclasticum sp. TaxID=2053595 RepID=UPI00289F52FF|nr:Crp/Fnr family transcriptional regulator [Proteiniclasticum sp.]